MVKDTKKLKVLTRDSLKEVVDDANTMGITDIIQVIERSSGEFTLIYRA
jgi:hypothetical protein